MKVIRDRAKSVDLDEFLSRPLFAHLATASEHGARESPVWFLWEDDALWIIGSGSSDTFPARIRADARCAVGIVDFDRATGLVQHVGMRGRATVERFDARRAWRLLARYLGSNESAWDERFASTVARPTAEQAVLVRFEPETVVARDVSYVPSPAKSAEPDRWSRWVLDRRDAGDADQRCLTLEHLEPIRDRVLAHAEPLEGASVLDVGTGDGLIGLEALERVGARGRVIFSDVSEPLLDECRRAVAARGLLDRARFVVTRAEDLDAIADASVDVVTTRSVLIYVADKTRAFKTLRRVLRPGGRISLFEPINRLTFPEPADRFWGYDISAVADLADKVKATFTDLQDPTTAAMTDFDDRDLVRFAESAGFERIHLECHIDREPGSLMRTTSMHALLDTAPNPLAPTFREVVSKALAAPEQQRFLHHLQVAMEQDRCVRRSALAYLAAETSAPRSSAFSNQWLA